MLTEGSDSSVILSLSFFHSSRRLLPQPTTDFGTGKKLDFTNFMYILNACSSYPNSIKLRYFLYGCIYTQSISGICSFPK